MKSCKFLRLDKNNFWISKKYVTILYLINLKKYSHKFKMIIKDVNNLMSYFAYFYK